MADLPVVNAIDELRASNKDNRERLQKSLRGGLLNVVKSVDRLHDAFQMSLNLQREQMDLNARLAMEQLEAERERQRKESAAKTKIEKAESPAEGGGLGILGIGAILAGIVASLGAIAVGFASELAKVINSVFFNKNSKFIKALDSSFKFLTEDLGKFFQQIKDNAARRLRRLQFRIDRSLRDLQRFFRPVIRFFDRLAFSRIGQLVDRALIKPTVDAFKLMGQVFKDVKGLLGFVDDAAKGTATAGKFLDGFLDIFKKVQPFIKVMGDVGRIVGKLFFPFTIIMTIWDTVKGAVEGYENEGFWGAFEGGLTGLLNSIVGAPLDILKAGVAWVLSKFGFSDQAEALQSFSFSDQISKIIGGVFDALKGAVDWVKTLFTDPKTALMQLLNTTFGAVYGENGLVEWLFFKPIDAVINWAKSLFGFETPGEGEDEKFSLKKVIMTALDDALKWLGSIFKFDSASFDKLLSDLTSGLPNWAKKLLGIETTKVEEAPKTTVTPEQVSAMESELDELNQSIRRAQGRQRTLASGAESAGNVFEASALSEKADLEQARIEQLLEKQKQLEGALVDAQSKVVADANRGGVGTVAVKGGDVFNQPETNVYSPQTYYPPSASRGSRSPQSRDVYADEQVMVF